MSMPFQIVGETKVVVTGAASARTPLPLLPDGKPARYTRIQVSNYCYVALGDSTVVATTQSLLLGPNSDVIICTVGNTHIAYIDLATSVGVSLAAVELSVPR